MTERGEASRIGASLHKNSGRGVVKGDASWQHFVVDIKEYEKSFSLSESMWSKVCTDAMKVDRNKCPMLLVVLGKGSRKVRLAVIELDELENLLERSQDNS